MIGITNIGEAYPALPRLGVSAPTTTTTASGSADIVRGTDRVEISPFGRAMAQALENSSYRVARINAIRAQIADGDCETPERIAGTVERLLDVVG